MSCLTLELMAHPELQVLADRAMAEAQHVARTTGVLIKVGDVERRMEELEEFHERDQGRGLRIER